MPKQIGQLSGDRVCIRLVHRIDAFTLRIQLDLSLTPKLVRFAFWTASFFPKLMGVIPDLLVWVFAHMLLRVEHGLTLGVEGFEARPCTGLAFVEGGPPN